MPRLHVFHDRFVPVRYAGELVPVLQQVVVQDDLPLFVFLHRILIGIRHSSILTVLSGVPFLLNRHDSVIFRKVHFFFS